MIALLLAALLVLAPTAARAAYEDLGAGARAPGMGNAFVPVADDVYAIYYNPAGLGLLEKPQLGTAYTSLYPGLTDGSNLSTSFLAYAQPLKGGRNGALALAWNAFTLNTSLYREDSFYLSYGRRVVNWDEKGELYAGVSGKYLRTTFGNFDAASNGVPTNGVVGAGLNDPSLAKRTKGAEDADIGLLYRVGKNYAAGLSFLHVNQPNIAFNGTDRLPLAVKAGFDYRSLISNIVLELDSEQGPTSARDNTVTAGVERWFPKAFLGDIGMRGGLSLGSRDIKQVSLGVSYRTHRLEVDYGMGLPLGGVATTFTAQRVGLTFRFGGFTEEEESLDLVLEAMKQFKAGQPVSLGLNVGQFTRAERVTIEEYLNQARALQSKAKYKAALAAFGNALTVAPANKELLERYSRLNVVGQQIAELPEYKIDPAQATLHMGVLAYLGGNDLEAVRQTTQALSLKPGWKEAEVFLANLELVTGVKRATFTPKRVNQDVAVKLARANAAIEDGEYTEAINLANEVLQQEPKNVAAWQDLGTAYFALRQFDRSLQSWRKAYDLETSPAVRAAIRNYLKSINRAKEKSRSIEKPASPASASRPAMTQQREQELFNAAMDHYTRREYDQARSLLEQILDADPENIEARKALQRVNGELP